MFTNMKEQGNEAGDEEFDTVQWAPGLWKKKKKSSWQSKRTSWGKEGEVKSVFNPLKSAAAVQGTMRMFCWCDFKPQVLRQEIIFCLPAPFRCSPKCRVCQELLHDLWTAITLSGVLISALPFLFNAWCSPTPPGTRCPPDWRHLKEKTPENDAALGVLITQPEHNHHQNYLGKGLVHRESEPRHIQIWTGLCFSSARR